MTNIQEQMRSIIESGIDGWITAQFASEYQPTDSLTDYPLTLETARIYYHSSMPYSAIEDGFLKSVGRVKELNASQMQEWASYHWQYARLELSEEFSNIKIEITDDMLERRQALRDEMVTKGYKSHLTNSA